MSEEPERCDYCDMADDDFEEGDAPPLLTYTSGESSTICHAECYAEMLAEGGCGDDDDGTERARLAAIIGVA